MTLSQTSSTSPSTCFPIPTDRLFGGALDWFDHLDDQHRVRVRFFGPPYPTQGTQSQRDSWVIQALRQPNDQAFFFANLAHKGLALDFQVLGTRPTGRPDCAEVVGTVPLAQLLLLPNEHPAEELAQMKAFLTWLDARLDNQGPDLFDGSVQWYRNGYAQSGLKAVGFADPAAAEALNQDLAAWRQEPWFEAWYRANMAGFGKIRLGPYCWAPLSSLVKCRARERMRALPPLSDEELGLA